MAETAKRTVSKVGVVTSNKMDKSVVVRIDRTVQDGRYKRYVQRSKNFMAHDEQNACREGDVVEIVECRPLSARKRWRVNRVVRKAVTLETPARAADPADQAGG